MADTINIGNYEVSCFKVGSSDCKIYLGDTLLYPHSTPTVKDYFRFVTRGDGYFTFYGVTETTANTLSYSLDSGTTWETLVHQGTTPYLDAGDVIMWKGENLVTNAQGMGRFSASTDFDVEGNVMSLHFGDDFEDKYDLSDIPWAFCTLFSGCTNVINASGLTLPATTISHDCYSHLFKDCSRLQSIPQSLPAMTMKDKCYYNMYYGCSGLTANAVPINYLPATTMALACYWAMFQWCSTITSAMSVLPAKTLAQGCYCNMFSRCTSLVTPPVISATTVASGCCQNMFYSGTSLTTTTSYMLAAPALTNYCYSQMFYYCSKVDKITCLATSNINTNYSTNNWVRGVKSSGTFTRASGVGWSSGNNGRPSGWTLVNYT